MIIDCHTLIWESPRQLGKIVRTPEASSGGGSLGKDYDASPDRHFSSCQPVDKAVVLGFRSDWLEANVPNDYISQYVRSHADRLIGFAGIDPTDPVAAVEELTRAHESLGLKGVVISPSAQDFHPSSTASLRVLAEVAAMGLPVMVHSGVGPDVTGKLEYARPHLLDEVARELPDLRMIVAHLGYPWVDECMVLLRKQPNVYADISGLVSRPWRAYNALLTAYELEVMRKLLFGSRFPFTSPAAAIEALYSLNQISHGTSLPNIPRESLRAIVESNATAVLGVSAPSSHRPTSSPGAVLDDEL